MAGFAALGAVLSQRYERVKKCKNCWFIRRVKRMLITEGIVIAALCAAELCGRRDAYGGYSAVYALLDCGGELD